MQGKEAETKMGKLADVCDDESGLDSHPGAACPQATAWSKEGDWFYAALVFPEHPFGGTQEQLLGLSCLPASILASVNS